MQAHKELNMGQQVYKLLLLIQCYSGNSKSFHMVFWDLREA